MNVVGEGRGSKCRRLHKAEHSGHATRSVPPGPAAVQASEGHYFPRLGVTLQSKGSGREAIDF